MKKENDAGTMCQSVFSSLHLRQLRQQQHYGEFFVNKVPICEASTPPCPARGRPSGLAAILFPPALTTPFVSSTEIPQYKLFRSHFHTVIINLVPFSLPFESGAYLQRCCGCCFRGGSRSHGSPVLRQPRSPHGPVLPQPRSPPGPGGPQRTLQAWLPSPRSRRCLFSPSSDCLGIPNPRGRVILLLPPPHLKHLSVKRSLAGGQGG